MKLRQTIYRILSYCFIIGILSSSYCYAGAPKFKLGGFLYPPFYSHIGVNPTGAAVDISAEIFERLKVQRIVITYPMKRLLKDMKSGEIDGSLFLLKTPERSEYLTYTEPLMKIRGLLWSRKDRKGGVIQFNNLEDLKKFHLGATLGYSYGVKLDRVLRETRHTSSLTDYDNYNLLLHGRIDAFPGNEVVAKGIFKKNTHFKNMFAPAKNSFADWEFHMVISNKSPLIEFLPEINKIISDLKNEGFIEKIINKYTG